MPCHNSPKFEKRFAQEPTETQKKNGTNQKQLTAKADNLPLHWVRPRRGCLGYWSLQLPIACNTATTYGEADFISRNSTAHLNLIVEIRLGPKCIHGGSKLGSSAVPAGDSTEEGGPFARSYCAYKFAVKNIWKMQKQKAALLDLLTHYNRQHGGRNKVATQPPASSGVRVCECELE